MDKLVEEKGETQEVLNVIAKITDSAKVMNSMLGNIVESEKEAPTINLEIQQMKNEIDRKNEDFVKFSLDNISIISDEEGMN
jgi:phage tail tube protein FII